VDSPVLGVRVPIFRSHLLVDLWTEVDAWTSSLQNEALGVIGAMCGYVYSDCREV
jgi:hypothetical protein